MPLFGIEIKNQFTNIVTNKVSSRISANLHIIFQSRFNTCLQADFYTIFGPKAKIKQRK